MSGPLAVGALLLLAQMTHPNAGWAGHEIAAGDRVDRAPPRLAIFAVGVIIANNAPKIELARPCPDLGNLAVRQRVGPDAQWPGRRRPTPDYEMNASWFGGIGRKDETTSGWVEIIGTRKLVRGKAPVGNRERVERRSIPVVRKGHDHRNDGGELDAVRRHFRNDPGPSRRLGGPARDLVAFLGQTVALSGLGERPTREPRLYPRGLSAFGDLVAQRPPLKTRNDGVDRRHKKNEALERCLQLLVEGQPAPRSSVRSAAATALRVAFAGTLAGLAVILSVYSILSLLNGAWVRVLGAAALVYVLVYAVLRVLMSMEVSLLC